MTVSWGFHHFPVSHHQDTLLSRLVGKVLRDWLFLTLSSVDLFLLPLGRSKFGGDTFPSLRLECVYFGRLYYVLF